MNDPRSILHANTFEPFVGHQGIGAQLEIILKDNVLILREKTQSQLILIASLGLLVIVPVWVLLYHSGEIHGGIVGKSILAGTALLIFPFLLKYLRRLLDGRRVEIRLQILDVCFIPRGQTVEQRLQFSQIKDVFIKETDYRDQGLIIKNYTVMAGDISGNQYALCTSDRKQDVALVYEKIIALLPKRSL